jgi:hypothetical protein
MLMALLGHAMTFHLSSAKRAKAAIDQAFFQFHSTAIGQGKLVHFTGVLIWEGARLQMSDEPE